MGLFLILLGVFGKASMARTCRTLGWSPEEGIVFRNREQNLSSSNKSSPNRIIIIQ